MSLVLVVARAPGGAPAVPSIVAPGQSAAVPGAGPSADARAGSQADVWRAVRDEVTELRQGAADSTHPRGLERLAGAIAADRDEPSIDYAPTAGAALDAVHRRLDAGALAVAVLPIAVAVDAGGGLRDPELRDLHRQLDDLEHDHPGAEVQYVGPPFDDAPALEAAIAALRPAGSEEPALLSGAIRRAFADEADRFGRFMAALQAGVPPGTRIALRGSAVQGVSYQTGEPFDARGPGTSDLDLVLLGEDAMAEWVPEAFYLPGVNTVPLWDEAADVATASLERARVAAQHIARRPVALQAMARWFLDLRSGLQGTPYVLLGG